MHESNFTVGTFTSPHIRNYNERIKINKKEIDTDSLIETFKMIDNLRGKTTLTYFEFATLSAFHLFHKEKLDYVILEVGLGGRLDATNIIDSDLSIITSIGIDHTEFLGTTIESIAMEKAGVMRSFSPCIFADTNPPSVLLTYAKKLGTNFLFNQNDYSVKLMKDSWIWKSKENKKLLLPSLPLMGDFQYNHAGAALLALEILEPKVLNNKDKLDNGINNITLTGRYQIISSNPEIIIDVAHNADSAKKLKDNLKKYPKKNTLAVIGLLKDKDVYSLIKPMLNVIDEWHCGTIDNQRGMNSNEIKTRMLSLVDKNSISTYDNMTDSIASAMSKLKPNDRLIIYGSFYTVSEFLEYYDNIEKLEDIS